MRLWLLCIALLCLCACVNAAKQDDTAVDSEFPASEHAHTVLGVSEDIHTVHAASEFTSVTSESDTPSTDNVDSSFDPYKVLNVSTTVTMRQLRYTYNKQAKKCHPVKSKRPDADKFIKLTRAYDMLVEKSTTTKTDEEYLTLGKIYTANYTRYSTDLETPWKDLAVAEEVQLGQVLSNTVEKYHTDVFRVRAPKDIKPGYWPVVTFTIKDTDFFIICACPRAYAKVDDRDVFCQRFNYDAPSIVRAVFAPYGIMLQTEMEFSSFEPGMANYTYETPDNIKLYLLGLQGPDKGSTSYDVEMSVVDGAAVEKIDEEVYALYEEMQHVQERIWALEDEIKSEGFEGEEREEELSERIGADGPKMMELRTIIERKMKKRAKLFAKKTTKPIPELQA